MPLLRKRTTGDYDRCRNHAWEPYPEPYPIFDTVIWIKARRCSSCDAVDVQKWKKR